MGTKSEKFPSWGTIINEFIKAGCASDIKGVAEVTEISIKTLKGGMLSGACPNMTTAPKVRQAIIHQRMKGKQFPKEFMEPFGLVVTVEAEGTKYTAPEKTKVYEATTTQGDALMQASKALEAAGAALQMVCRLLTGA